MTDMKEESSISFAEWMSRIDDICLDKLGVSVYDFADMMFFDRFEEGCSPSEFVELEIMKEQEDVGYYGFFE